MTMTRSRYLFRRVKRLEQKHRRLFRMLAGQPALYRAMECVELLQARWDLAIWAEARVRPSMTDVIWRSKRDGGPYRLAPPQEQEAA